MTDKDLQSDLQMVTNVSTAIKEKGLIPDVIMPYIFTINYSIICLVLSLFGIAANVINIIIFIRQGLKETINVSLLGLAVSDLCSLISLLWVSICFNPYFMYSDLPILTVELQHFSGGWTHMIFVRITGFITVFITLERCLCIAFPLKVKTLLTPRRVKIVIIAIYVVVIGSMCKNFFNARLGWAFIEGLNRTMLTNIYYAHSGIVETVSFYMQLFYPISSFTAVVICTAILVSKINQRSKWRQSVTTGENDNKAAVRDRQVVKMVVYVAVIFIISFTPSLLLFTSMLAVHGMNMGEKNGNLFILFVSCSFSMEGLNSSVNIFVYYKTSSRYKEEFQACFCAGGKLKSDGMPIASRSSALK